MTKQQSFFSAGNKRMCRARLLLITATVLASMLPWQIARGQEGASATEAPAESASRASAPHIASGKQSRAWLDQQTTGQQASKTRQSLSGPVMSKVHKRYVDSFAQPIKDTVRDTSSISNR